MATFSRVSILFQNMKQLLERTKIWRIDSSHSFSTCNTLLKRRPSTVGVPAWAKAATKRRAQVLHLEKKKTVQQMQAESRLADINANKSDFLTSTRVGVHRPKLTEHQNRTEMAVTDNQKVLLFYHPEHNYPVQHSKVVKAEDWISTEDCTNEGYKDCLSQYEISEIQSLQKTDPKLWSVDILSDMFKVKPIAILEAAPLTSDQELELEVEQDFLSHHSDYERKEYESFKASERRRQLKIRNKKQTAES